MSRFHKEMERMELEDALNECEAACVITPDGTYWRVDGSSKDKGWIVDSDSQQVQYFSTKEEAVAAIPEEVQALKWRLIRGLL